MLAAAPGPATLRGIPGGLGFASRRVVAGSPATVRAGLEQVIKEYAPDELMLVNILHGHEDRKRSYTLAMDAMTPVAA